MSARVSCAVAGVLMAVASCLSAAEPSWTPPKPTNLQVLEKKLSGREVVATMRGFTRSLGVRCQHCHVYKGKDPNDLNSFDFASDEKDEKGVARAMLRMVFAINNNYLKDVGEHAASTEPRVTCYTCHRGEKEPPAERADSDHKH